MSKTWLEVWRQGVAPLLSDAGLAALAQALRTDDVRLIQGRTVLPHFGPRPEGACAIGYAGWVGDGLDTPDDIEAEVASVCVAVDSRMGPGSVCNFLRFFDTTPRDEVRRLLTPEVDAEIERRATCAR